MAKDLLAFLKFCIEMNINFLTNFIAFLLILIGFIAPFYGEIIMNIGIFALLGGLTNWLAIFMIFEKVPFLYGSGVIINRFADFKNSIKKLIVNEFFNKEHIEQFFANNNSKPSNFIEDKIDFDKVFDGLVESIIQSPMGSMLSMFGGREALEPIKEPIIVKLKSMIQELVQSNVNGDSDNFVQNLTQQIEKIIDKRLLDLTPKMVKDIIQNIIHKHLSWLVIWGAIFGGLMGLVYSLF